MLDRLLGGRSKTLPPYRPSDGRRIQHGDCPIVKFGDRRILAYACSVLLRCPRFISAMDSRRHGGMRMLATAQTCAVIGLDGQIIQAETDISPGTACLPHRRIARHGSPGVQGTGPGCPPQQRLRVPNAPHHGESCARGPEKSRPRLRFAHRRRHIVQHRTGPTHGGTGHLSGRNCLWMAGCVHTAGILPMVSVAREQGIHSAYVPSADAAEAALVDGVTVYPVDSLAQLVEHLQGNRPIEPFPHSGIHLNGNRKSPAKHGPGPYPWAESR